MDLIRIKHYSQMAPIGVMRYSGQFLIRPESVPDHVASCTTLAIMIIKDLRNLGFEVDTREVIYRLAIHDLPERVTSDIIRPLKYHHEELTKQFRIAEESMIRRAGYPDDLIEDIINVKCPSTIEGNIVAFVDTFQVITKLYEEVHELNNNLIRSEFENALIHFQNATNRFQSVGNEELFTYFNNIYKSFI